MRVVTAMLVLALLVLALLGCDDSEAPEPTPPPPEISVAMHVHLGRPGATVGMAMRLVGGGSSSASGAAAKRGTDVTALLSDATGLESSLVQMADLLQPADLLVIDSGGERHRIVSMAPVPELGSHVPTTDGYAMKAGPPATVVGPSGEVACVVSSKRLWCSPTAGDRLAGLARAAEPVVAQWARDHTDAVIEVEGSELRKTVWPALKGDAAILRSRVAARLAHEVEGPLGSWVKAMGELSPEPLLAVVDRAVVRVRLDGGQARLEARIDVDVPSEGADEGMVATLAGLHESAPLVSALGTLPSEVHALALRADATLSDAVVWGEVTRIASGSEALAEKVKTLQASLLPGVVGGVTWAGERRVLMEAQRSRDPKATKEALGALAVTMAASGDRPALTIRPVGGGVAIETGALLAHLALVTDTLVIASGDAADPGIDDGALAAVIPAGRQTKPLKMAGPLAPYAVGLGLQSSALAHPGRAAGPLLVGFRVTEKTPKHLRAALMMQADRDALGELAQMVRLGRAKRPDPALTRRDEDEAGNASD